MIWFAAVHRQALASWYRASDPSQHDPEAVAETAGRVVEADVSEGAKTCALVGAAVELAAQPPSPRAPADTATRAPLSRMPRSYRRLGTRRRRPTTAATSSEALAG